MSGLVEQRTSRELEVVGMLAAGRRDQAIANEPVVNVDTIEKHVSHVLDKLWRGEPHRSRRQGTELGLIP